MRNAEPASTHGWALRWGGECRSRLSKQALRYALIVLPYGQHRASLRACLLNQEPLTTYGEK
jgi:hypothetical protein